MRERYERGELTKEEFEQLKGDLGWSLQPSISSYTVTTNKVLEKSQVSELKKKWRTRSKETPSPLNYPLKRALLPDRNALSTRSILKGVRS